MKTAIMRSSIIIWKINIKPCFGVAFLVLALHVFSATSVEQRPGRNRNAKTQVRIGVLLPVDSDRLFSIQKCLPAIQHAFVSERVKAMLPNCEFLTINANSKCNSIAAPIEAFNMMELERVNVFFGPVCDYSLAPVARYTPTWDVPVISPGGMAKDFGLNKREKDGEFRLLTRVGITFDGLAKLVYRIVHNYNWTNVKVSYYLY